MARGSTLWILYACIIVLVIANPNFKGKKGCKLKGGEILKEKQSQKSECFEYKCLKKKGKFVLKSILRKNKCCKLDKSVVSNKWTTMIRGNLTSCISGKLQVKRNPSKKVIQDEMEKSVLRKLFIIDKLGVNIGSLENVLPEVDLLIGRKGQKRKQSELLKKEFENIIKKHNYRGYIYGIENVVNLIENEKLKNLITSKINQLRAKNGYRKLEFSNENRTMNHRVLGGDEATRTQIGFQARLEINSCDKWGIPCGGVLISKCFVLTAKHCVDNVKDPQENIQVILGDTSSGFDFSFLLSWLPGVDTRRQNRDVLFIYYHETQDIAILKLKTAATATQYVRTIPILENPNYDIDTDFGYVSGWGVYIPDKKDNSYDLRYRKFTVPKWSICKEFAGGNVDMVCAKYACSGDSGGPMYTIVNNRHFLWGIISISDAECDVEYLGCVDVAYPTGSVNSWIKKTVGDGLGKPLQWSDPGGSECHCHEVKQCKQISECPDGDAICFPASSTTVLDDGQIKPISELMVGDKILAGNRQGKPIFSKFIGWLHKDERKEATFLKISSKTGSITISPDHLILSKSQDNDVNIKYVFAKDIKIRDQVTMKLHNNTFNWATVTQIQQRVETGVFAPLTEEGTVVVDGILASTYTLVDHDLAHAAFSIVRYFPSLLDDTESQHFNGLRTFPKVLITIARMLNLLEEDGLKEEDKETTFCNSLYFALGLWIIVYIKKKI